MSKPFVAIVGNRNSGKSTIIRSLTGARTGQYRGPVEDRTTSRYIEVIGSSPQENPMSHRELRRILGEALANNQCNGVVCALQPTKPTTRISMEEVLQEAADQGFDIYAFALDPDYSMVSPDFDQIKQRLSRVSVKPIKLDGQRFAHINATLINSRARIVS